jgi:hypothetical protein
MPDASPADAPTAGRARLLRALRWDDNPRRSLAISGVGAVIGLAIAGFGLFTAKGTAYRSVPPEAVATVNQKPIQRRDYDAQLVAEFNIPVGQASRAQKQKVLGEMIREELLVQRGLELDLAATDSDIRSALMSGMQTQVALDATAKRPTDAELLRYFEQHPERYSDEGVLVLEDLTSGAGDPAAIAAATEALNAGQPLEAVKARFGLRDSGVLQGEQYYFVVKLRLHDRLFALARGLKAGQAAVGQGDDGAPHLLAVIKNTPPVAQRFADVKASVIADYQKAQTARLLSAETQYLRKRSDILVAPDLR